MKKTFKHEGKSCTVEVLQKEKVRTVVGWEPPKEDGSVSPITDLVEMNVIIGKIDGKAVSVKQMPPEDDVSHYAEQMEEELKVIAKRPRKAANPHLKKLKDKGYK